MKKIAVIELGTLQVKLAIANVLDEGMILSDEYTDAIKMASDLSDNGILKTARIQELLTVLKSYKNICASFKITDVFCVASVEYLEAKNQRSLLEEIYNQTGFKFKIMSEDEQISKCYTAVVNTMDIPKGVICFIGGNASQIVYYNRRNLLNYAKIDLGGHNLAEKCFDEKQTPEEYCDKMYKVIKAEVSKIDWIEEVEPESKIVGAGNSFISFAKLSRKLKKYNYEREHNYTMDSDDISQLYDFIKVLDIDKAKKLKGISSDRADVLASSLCIAKAVRDVFELKELSVSKNSVAEGILINEAVDETNDKPLSDVLGGSLSVLNSYYNNFSTNTNNVYQLSMVIFKQLKVLHKLNRSAIRILRTASILHDCGKRINCRDYTKYGFDVVLNSEIYGLTHKEQVMAAFVVCCQHLEDFNMTEWVKYKEILLEEDLDTVRQLASIVSLADALDRYSKGRVTDVNCDILGDSVIFKTIVTSSADLEIREALKVENDFLKAFHKHLEIL